MVERTVEYEIDRLRKRVAALEVRDAELVKERLNEFQRKLNHMYVQICKRVGPIEMPAKRVEAQSKGVDPRAGVQAIAQEMQRDRARKDGERGDDDVRRS